MKIWKLTSLFCLLFFANLVQAKDINGAMTVNGDMSVKFNGSEFKARVSAAFTPNAEDLYAGKLGIEQFNLVILGVPQSSVTGRKPVGNESGALGFSVSGEDSTLRYNPQTRKMEGRLHGFVNIPGYVDPKPEPIDQSREHEDHVFSSPTQEAVLHISISSKKDLLDMVGVDKQITFDGEMQLSLDVASNEQLKIRDYNLEVKFVPVIIDWGWFFETAKNLCVQPVRIARFQPSSTWPPILSVQYTGQGYPFGKPGAITEWKKADLTLTWRAWQTTWNSSFWDFSENEHAALRATVDVDECVEIYFVDNMQPDPFWGGGATFDSGTANAKIISTDENADFGVDLTHLAHELGHAVSLCHPGSSSCVARPEMNPASTGTLMCPSGFNNDNPAVNSTQNENNINNPLTTFTLKLISAGADCANSSSCGACP